MIKSSSTLLLLLLILPASVMSQEKIQYPSIEEIRAEIELEAKNIEANPNLSKAQNDLLKKKKQRKVKYELSLLDSNYVFSTGLIHDLAHKIFHQILISNPSVPQNTRIVISKSNQFNAFTMGDNVIFVHLGLLYHLRNEAEIALVLSHELAHNTLKHVEKSMILAVVRETDPDFHRDVKKIFKNEYGVVSALNELIIPRIFESREQSRKHEFEADSLGYVYLKNAGYDPKAALAMFRSMEAQSDKKGEIIDLTYCTAIAQFPSILDKENEYSQLGSLGAFEESDTNDLQPYLATHPYERDRFKRLATQDKFDLDLEMYSRKVDSVYHLKFEMIGAEMIQNSVKSRNLTDAFYYSCKYVIDFPEDPNGYKMMTVILKSVSFLKDRRVSGKYLRRQNPFQPEDLDRITHFLNSLSPKECNYLAEKSQDKFAMNPIQTDAETALIKMFDFLANEKYEDLYAIWLADQDMVRASNYGWIFKELEQYLYVSNKVSKIKPNKK